MGSGCLHLLTKLPYRREHPSLSHICRYPLLMGGASGVRERERVTVREYPVFPPRVYKAVGSIQAVSVHIRRCVVVCIGLGQVYIS